MDPAAMQGALAAGALLLLIFFLFSASAVQKVSQRNEEARKRNEAAEAANKPYKPEIERNPVIDGFLLVIVAMGLAFLGTLALSSVLPLLPK